MRILIVEDEQAAFRRLKKMVEECINRAEIFDEIDSVKAATKWLKSHPAPDLIFMDIQLADGTCFDIFKATEVTAPVIFTSAYDQYAIRSFEVNAVSYLLKPVKETELEQAIKKFERMKTGTSPDYSKLLESLQVDGSYQKRLLIKIGQTFHAVEVADIAYFYTQNKIVTLVTFENRKFPIDYNLDQLEEILDPKVFSQYQPANDHSL